MIHETAVIEPGAELGEGVSIGPYSIIGKDVSIGDGTQIGPHVVIKGPTRIGRENKIYQFASLGEDPQDKKYDNEETWLEIGDRNTIREFCTFNRGTIQDKAVTRIGNENWVMAYVHIAHDCMVGNNTIFANNASLAGHVAVEDFAILGGFTLVHQFCRIGAHSFSAMNSVISKDVPPYVMVSGHMAKPYGLNTEGLKRRGMSAEAGNQLRRAYKLIYRSGKTLKEAITELEPERVHYPEIDRMLTFLSHVTRGIVR